MGRLDHALLVDCCRALHARQQNQGAWPDKKIPECLVRVKELYGLGDDNWTLVVEAIVKMDAVTFIAQEQP